MQIATQPTPSSSPGAIEAARVAIWRLYEEGFVDEDMATAGLLAVDLGTRRKKHKLAAVGAPKVGKTRHGKSHSAARAHRPASPVR
jgi:hypothetical protein